ncbi:MAG TPA: short-chain fatty acyl-CoA regulator family protein [Haliangiales bacterium]|nr:short-chain fatty acyl-CoA regulator family protein [Haliangiales bacterium]
MDNVLIGQRLRRLRMDKSFRQSDIAKQLGISPAYLNLIEKGKRTIQFPLLWKALEIFGQDLESFMGALGERRPDDALAKLIDDPLAQTLDLDEEDVARLQAEPKAATTIAALFNLYKNTRAQLDTAMAKLQAGDVPRLDYAPSDEVSDFLQAHKNFFPELEEEAEEMRRDCRLGRRVISDQLVAALGQRFGYTVRFVPPGVASSVVRKIDVDRKVTTVSSGLTEQPLKFQLAATAGLLVLDRSRLHERLVADARPRHAETARLIKIHLANYFAGALLLPYDDYYREAQRTRYDVDALADIFEMSYEACAHRLCNLSDARRPGIPLHFLRVDVAGNISKKYSGTGIKFPHGSGSCPKWAVHQAFLTPSVITRQYSMMPDGTTYFCFAKVALAPQQGSLVRGTTYSIGLGTTPDAAKYVAYAQDLPAQDLKRTAVPCGVSCRFCERTDCNQRAAPSYKFVFAVDEYTKKDNFFSPLVGDEAAKR